MHVYLCVWRWRCIGSCVVPCLLCFRECVTWPGFSRLLPPSFCSHAGPQFSKRRKSLQQMRAGRKRSKRACDLEREGEWDMCTLVGLDEGGPHSTHAITRAHCAALAVKGVARASLKTTLCMHARLAEASSLSADSALQVSDEAEETWEAAWRNEGCTATGLPSQRGDSTSCQELKASCHRSDHHRHHCHHCHHHRRHRRHRV